MAATLRRWAAGVMQTLGPRRRSPSYVQPELLVKVEGMKEAGAPTQEASGILQVMEYRLKAYRKLWEDDERQVQGLLRNGLEWRAHIAFLTIASVATLVKGYEYADMHRFKSGK